MERPESPRRGFAQPGKAAEAARKNHELGTAHRFTSETGRAASEKAGANRGRPRKLVELACSA